MCALILFSSVCILEHKTNLFGRPQFDARIKIRLPCIYKFVVWYTHTNTHMDIFMFGPPTLY